MRLWKRKENRIPGKKKSRRYFGLERWPDDVWGWLRIPAMIAGITGILGIVKYTSPQACRLLKSFNLPSIEFCWMILIASVAVYLLCFVYWLLPKSSVKVSPERKGVSLPPQQWRRF
jgi:protein-S-isoprenylcysteine O-methyltransferase Ste14